MENDWAPIQVGNTIDAKERLAEITKLSEQIKHPIFIGSEVTHANIAVTLVRDSGDTVQFPADIVVIPGHSIVIEIGHDRVAIVRREML